MLETKQSIGATYELAGPTVLTFREVGEFVAREIGDEHEALPLIKPIAMLLAYLNEFTWTPVFTRDYVIRARYDNILDPNTKAKTFKDLGIEPQPLEKYGPIYLKRWKKSATFFMDVNAKG